ncbi:heme peroxidase [Streptomyces laurentii]|uniref:Heme peroxidase n=1 Tax=Streptomyces laurentii TaxID=39478 RepID=A0A160P9N8_STRLU|nr:heme peroxidase [Streptomyces laurentii]
MRVIRRSRATFRRLVVSAVAVASLVGSGLVSAQPAMAAPVFQAPFACGETWRGATRSDHNDYHSIDFNWGSGSDDYLRPVHASAAGKVTGSGVYNDGVSYVLVDHGGGWATRYLHMQVGSLLPVGTTVRMGQVVGKVSDVGSPGAYHLHFEQRYNGEIVAATFDGVPFSYPDQSVTSRNCGGAASGGFGDWSGDGKADVLARQASTGNLYLYKGTGAGKLQTGNTQIGSGWGGMDALVRHGDFDGDGSEDVVAREASTGDLYLYRGNGTGGFQTGNTKIDNGWNGMDAILSPGDFDGDGNADILARQEATGDLYLYRGNGAGGLQTGNTKIDNGWNGMDAILSPGDFDGDGNADILARQEATGDLYLYRGNGAGGLQTGNTKIDNGWNGMDAILSPGDFDGDGNADILARQEATGDLYLYRGNGAGGLQTGNTKIDNGWNGMDAILSPGDFDGDGNADILARQEATGDLYLYRGNGAGGLQTGNTKIDNGWNGMNAVF